MRYLLVLGFACDMYRLEPRARIFVGDRLVDEFSIPHTPSNFHTARKEFLTKLHPLQPVVWTEVHSFKIKNFPPIKFYELQIDDDTSNLEIRIGIDNNDSNYNNGYITRSTLLSLEVCNFFPLEEKLLRRLKKIRDRRRESENLAWYYMIKNGLFDLAANGMCWRGKNNQRFESNTHSSLKHHKVGGDGTYVCQLIKKYGMLMPTLVRAYRYHFCYAMTSYFYNKYYHHAHQRNSD